MTSKNQYKLVGDYLSVIAGAGSPYLIAFLGVKLALPGWPMIAFIASVITLVIAIGAAVGLSRFIKHSRPTTVAIVALFVASTYASVGAFAGLSATIHAWRPESYSVTAAPPLIPIAGSTTEHPPTDDPFEIFSNYYLVVMLDLVPGIEFSKTLILPTTVEAKSRLGGLPVLGFKIYVLLAVIGAYKKWKEVRKERSKSKKERVSFWGPAILSARHNRSRVAHRHDRR